MTDLVARIKEYGEHEISASLEREKLNPEETALLADYKAQIWAVVYEELSWPRLQPIAVEVFRSSYSPEDIAALTAFYRSDAGRAVVEKVPNATSVLTSERIERWDSIRNSEGDEAADNKIKEEIGVSFRPSEMAGFCEFFTSPTGKDVAARSPGAMKQLNERWLNSVDHLTVRLEALRNEYQGKLEAAAAKK